MDRRVGGGAVERRSLIDPKDQNSGYLVHPQMILNWPDFHTRGLALAKLAEGRSGCSVRRDL